MILANSSVKDHMDQATLLGFVKIVLAHFGVMDAAGVPDQRGCQEIGIVRGDNNSTGWLTTSFIFNNREIRDQFARAVQLTIENAPVLTGFTPAEIAVSKEHAKNMDVFKAQVKIAQSPETLPGAPSAVEGMAKFFGQVAAAYFPPFPGIELGSSLSDESIIKRMGALNGLYPQAEMRDVGHMTIPPVTILDTVQIVLPHNKTRICVAEHHGYRGIVDARFPVQNLRGLKPLGSEAAGVDYEHLPPRGAETALNFARLDHPSYRKDQRHFSFVLPNFEAFLALFAQLVIQDRETEFKFVPPEAVAQLNAA